MVRPKRKRTQRRRNRKQRGGSFDIQKLLGKTGIEFHWPGYQFMGPGTHLKKRLAWGDKGINRLDRIARQHDIDYANAKSLQDKWKADAKMISTIDKLPGKKTLTERVVKKIMQAKKRLKLWGVCFQLRVTRTAHLKKHQAKTCSFAFAAFLCGTLLRWQRKGATRVCVAVQRLSQTPTMNTVIS